jgi:NAD+ synthase (glutamine-hydrolysing)
VKIEDLPAIVLVQMEVLPARPDLNVAKMRNFIDRARDGGAEIIVFSELCISGYILGDLWEVDALVEDFAAYSDEVRRASEGVTVLFGNVVADRAQIGEDGRLRKYNAVCVCSNMAFVERPLAPNDLPPGVQPKTLHPNYRFFDDDRHFYSMRKLSAERGGSIDEWMVPFEIVRKNGKTFSFGVQLCEDIWCQDYNVDGQVLDTLKMYHGRGADALFNLSASPWTWKKNDKRNRVVSEVLAQSPIPFFYVNQVGAQNNGKNVIVFDGDTTAYSADGRVTCRALPWREEMLSVARREPPPIQGEMEAIYDGILTGLRHLDQLRGNAGKYLVGVSGGVDSSTVAALMVRTFGPERVLAVNMPSRFNSSITRENARRLCADLGVEILEFSIQKLYEQLSSEIQEARFQSEAGEYTRLEDENLQARIRGADVLSGLAAKFGLVYTNNGNKTETALGYATLYGDVNGAIAPIADLYKVQVLELARFLNRKVFESDYIPRNLLDGSTVPSAELSAQQDVTKGLGDPIKYGYHDAVLRQMIEYRKHPVDFLTWFIDGRLLQNLGWEDPAAFRNYFPTIQSWIDDLEQVERLLRVNYFKRVQAPPIIVLSKRAFGFDLRESQLPAYAPIKYAALKEKALALEPT